MNLNKYLNVYTCMSNTDDDNDDDRAVLCRCPCLMPALPPSLPQVLVSQDYYAAKEELLDREQALLRLLDFTLCADPLLPLSHLLNLLHLLAAPQPLAAAALSCLNDSLTYSDVCLDQPPLLQAAAAVHVRTLAPAATAAAAAAAAWCIRISNSAACAC